jgi:ligand-binding sensor domain-containing protein
VVLKTGDENDHKHFLLVALIMAATKAAFSQYNFSSWTVDSLPQNGFTQSCIDGYLWFTIFDGLVRFDGLSFTIFSKSNTKGLNSNLRHVVRRR